MEPQNVSQSECFCPSRSHGIQGNTVMQSWFFNKPAAPLAPEERHFQGHAELPISHMSTCCWFQNLNLIVSKINNAHK